jgi:thiosulfate dehydrogenase [quinone] large subunit
MDNDHPIEHLITFLLRMFLGILFFFAGLGKIKMGMAAFRELILTGFEKTFLPEPMLSLFAYVLPPVELLIGVLLLVGLATRPALLLTALTLTVLFFGLVVSQQQDKAPGVALYFLITLFALRNAEFNKLSIDHVLNRNR